MSYKIFKSAEKNVYNIYLILNITLSNRLAKQNAFNSQFIQIIFRKLYLKIKISIWLELLY